MIQNYFKIAWRSLWRHKAYSLINIVGLSIGLTACLIVATVVFDELSYDRQWSKGDDIYRVLSKSNDLKGNGFVPATFSAFGPMVKKDLPEVADYCRMSVVDDRLILTNNKEGIKFENLRAEPSVWNLLDFKVIAGNPHQYVKGYTNLIITKKIQQQYFAGQNPIGKVINTQPQYGSPQQYLITGVIDNIPTNTNLRADFITTTAHSIFDDQAPRSDQGYTFLQQYILLRHGTNINTFTAKVNKWYQKQLTPNTPNFGFGFQSIKDVYLRSDFNWYQQVHGSITNVYIFGGVALLLLVIACINFVNLTISRVFNRSKETGIRKVLGAEKLQIMIRFLSESLIFFLLSFVIAILLYPVFVKPVESYLGHQLVLNLYNSSFLVITIACVFVISLLTGLYPAWFLARPNPIVIIRNKTVSNIELNLLKKGLVVGQFVISVSIILSAIIIHNQISFINRKDLGFNKNNLLNISFTMWGQSAGAFKQQVKQIPGVQNASMTDWAPTEGAGSMSMDIKPPGQKDKMTVYFITGDEDLPATMGLRLRAGRVFNPQLSSDEMDADSAMQARSAATMKQSENRAILTTDYTAKLFGVKIGQHMRNINGIPVGILEDFNGQSLHEKLQPTFIQAAPGLKYGNMLVRIKPGYEQAALTAINKVYKSFYADKTFQYNWVSDEINDQYKAEHKLQQLFTCFSLLIIFLACLGLFGLVSFTAEQRVKEIGIRKVLGAGIGHIVTLLSKDYLALVMLSVVIASPIAWYAMNKWLQGYAYRISIQWWVFALAGVLALLIAFITISFQSIKAAVANPVKSLRSE